MKILFSFILLFSLSIQSHINENTSPFDRDLFYKALYSNKIQLIDQQLDYAKVLPLKDRMAFEGILLMKKAGLLKNIKEKLELFKMGKNQLESSILKDPQNCEYRFLRLIIQENAPKILGYNTNIKEDCDLIKKEYKSSSKVLKKNILEFSKNSLNLRLSS